MSQYVPSTIIQMSDKHDFKKTFFEEQLNKNPHLASGLMRRMLQYGYHCEYENGRYYVYNSYEWDIKKQYEEAAKSILDHLLGK